MERWKAPGRGTMEAEVASGEGLGRPVRAEAIQVEGVAQKACWEDLGKAPFSGARPGGPCRSWWCWIGWLGVSR